MIGTIVRVIQVPALGDPYRDHRLDVERAARRAERADFVVGGGLSTCATNSATSASVVMSTSWRPPDCTGNQRTPQSIPTRAGRRPSMATFFGQEVCMAKAFRVALLVGGVATCFGAIAALRQTAGAKSSPASAPAAGRIEPQADEILRRMSNSLKGLSGFAFDADHMTEVVLESGQKLQMAATSRVQVQRPNRLRSDRRGELANVSLYYDGKALTVMGHKVNLYAQAPAPSTLDAAIDFARDELEMEAPAADLLYSDPYRGLTEDVVSGTYVGKAEIDGARVHHLAFRGREVDWQIWIEDGPRALPRRYVITSKEQQAAPEFVVTLKNWSVNQQFPDGTFAFQAPAGAEQIGFLGMKLPKAARTSGGGK
jgi:hypothetical protein